MKDKDLRYWRRMIFFLGLFKIPMLLFVRPKLVSVSDEKVELLIKLRRRTKNHLGSMYFGALAVGADVAAGLFAFYHAKKLNTQVSFAFKSMEVEFVKRAESDTRFICDQGQIVQTALAESKKTGQRVNRTVEVIALDKSNEVVATMKMEVSVKAK